MVGGGGAQAAADGRDERGLTFTPSRQMPNRCVLTVYSRRQAARHSPGMVPAGSPQESPRDCLQHATCRNCRTTTHRGPGSQAWHCGLHAVKWSLWVRRRVDFGSQLEVKRVGRMQKNSGHVLQQPAHSRLSACPRHH